MSEYRINENQRHPERPFLRSGRFATQDPNEVAFAKWLAELETLVGTRWPGATLDDCPARPYRMWFETDGDSPEEGLAEIERTDGAELDEQFVS